MFAACSAAILALFAFQSLWAEDALFIGNSYTYGGPETTVRNHGGVPKIVEAIAASKGKRLSTLMVTVGNMDLAYHLAQKRTEEALASRKWNWVVLQDFSSEATHIGHVDSFFASGLIFYRRIISDSSQTKMVLYEPWARPKGSPFYTGTDTATTFTTVSSMNLEIQSNYCRLINTLKAITPRDQVELAPVGEAFERSLQENPDIQLYYPDGHHASLEGSYLAALVIYATLYRDDPNGATRNFFGTEIPEEIAVKLQAVAHEAVGLKNP